jgi:flagellar biosynthesis protein FlhG
MTRQESIHERSRWTESPGRADRRGPGWDPELEPDRERGAQAGRPGASGPIEQPEPQGLLRRRQEPLLTVAVTGGKGGVGKTNLVTNLAVIMARMGKKVLLLDGDFSLANVDLLLGLVPHSNLYDVVSGRKRIDEIVLTGEAGIRIIPAASGVEEMAALDDYRREVLIRSLENLASDRDVLLIDTGSGIHRQNLRLAQMADEILVLTTPEPTAFSDAYATIKVLSSRRLARPPRLVVNMAHSEAEALRIARRVARVASQFLGFEPELYGIIPNDEAVPRAVKAQEPFVKIYEDSPAAVGVRELAKRLLQPLAAPIYPRTQQPEPEQTVKAA